jgi:hypothetical protein
VDIHLEPYAYELEEEARATAPQRGAVGIRRAEWQWPLATSPKEMTTRNKKASSGRGIS